METCSIVLLGGNCSFSSRETISEFIETIPNHSFGPHHGPNLWNIGWFFSGFHV